MTQEQRIQAARQLRHSMTFLASKLSDTEACGHLLLFPLWHAGAAYTAGERVRYGSKLYKCIQPHTAQAGWLPDVVPSLWNVVADPTEAWPEWIQPQGAHDGYSLGDQVSFNQKHWISQVDNNVWKPGEYGWEAQMEEFA